MATTRVSKEERRQRTAQRIIEASPAPHTLGGRPPGAAEVAAAARTRRVDLAHRLAAPGTPEVYGGVEF